MTLATPANEQACANLIFIICNSPKLIVRRKRVNLTDKSETATVQNVELIMTFCKRTERAPKQMESFAIAPADRSEMILEDSERRACCDDEIAVERYAVRNFNNWGNTRLHSNQSELAPEMHHRTADRSIARVCSHHQERRAHRRAAAAHRSWGC